MNSFFERQFRLQENHTTVSTEVIAGLTTFATMGYVLAVVPHMMGEAGVPTGAMLTGMVLMIFVTSMVMGLYTNRPFALAPGMGSVAIFSITMVQLQNVPIGVASAIVFLSGLLFIAVTVLGIRKAIVMTIPRGIKISISAGVGIFLAVIGMRNAKLLAVNAKKVALSFGDLTQPVVLLAAITFIILLVLSARKVRGGALISILAGTVIGIPMGVTKLPESIFRIPDSIAPIFFNFDLGGALNLAYLPFLFAFFLPDFFSSFGTAIGIGGKAGFLDKNGDLPGLDKVFHVDSIAATIGSLFTIPVLITYLESGAGVEAGGRTGLTACTTLLILAVTPLALMIPAAATAPVLIYVGVSMMAGMRNLDYTDIAEYIPAFLCVAFTAFTFNIANGISVAFISFVIMKVAMGRTAELHKGHYLLALLLAYYFYAIAGVK